VEIWCGLGGHAVIRQAISCDICGTEKKQTNHWFVAYDQGGELRVSGWNSRNRLRPGSKHLCGQTCLHKLVDDFMAKTLAFRPSAAAEEIEIEDPMPAPTPRPQARSERAPQSGYQTAYESRQGTRYEPKYESRFDATEAPLSAIANPGPDSADSFADEKVSASRLGAAHMIEEHLDDTSLISGSAHGGFESSARLISPAEAAAIRRAMNRPAAGLVAVAPRVRPEEPATILTEESARIRGVEKNRARVEEPVTVAEETPRFSSRNWRAEAWEREREREREQRTIGQHAKIPARRRAN
jgi:hypothetical protein